ncbi:MAG: helical backbone metal receptor [Planctomycetaceae bacterium]|nr:helical backbone metal receptor [Planctomycetaceae bacterium]
MRLISMAPNITEILFELGLDTEIVGVTSDSDYPPQAAQKRKVGSFWQPDIEAVLACRPTLVVTESFPQQSTLAARLEKVGCKTLVVDVWSLNQLYTSIAAIGQAVDRRDQAQTLVDRLQSKQNEIAARHQDAANKPKVLWVIQRQPLLAASPKAFGTELINICGGVNAVTDTFYQYPPINTESLLAAMPDIIIEPSEENVNPTAQLQMAKAFYARFSGIPAVRDGRIYVVDADKVSRLGPRIDGGMELVEQCLWPGGQP